MNPGRSFARIPQLTLLRPVGLGLTAVLAIAATLAVAPSRAQSTHGSEPSAMRLAAPPKAIGLTVDARDATKKLFHSHEVIPVESGPVRLYYPKWIPGEHGPTGPLTGLAGVRITIGGRPLEWRRDLEDMYSLHCDVPNGVHEITVDFDMQTAQENSGFSSGASSSAELAVLNWNQHVLYPADVPVDQVTVNASLRLPEGWRAASALPVAHEGAGSIEFQPVSLLTLVDSPVQMGAFTRAIPLNPGDSRPVTLHLAADSRAALDIGDDEITHYRALVSEARALFGARHYRHYDFLYTLSDHVASFGLEHHESSDDRVKERTLIDPPNRLSESALLSHEYMHSWNGKYRRPADLTTPDYQKPMETDLLWVYEGLTQYLGCLLAARSGLETPEQYRENVAMKAGRLETERGRDWRPLLDTAVEAQLLYEAPDEGAAWRRGVDFYDESLLMWLEADAIIRERSGGRLSLDDFCRRFHGGDDTSPRVVTYTREDVIRTLDGLVRYDWAAFFRDRVDRVQPHPPLGGLEAEGWRLAWRDSSSEFYKAEETHREQVDLSYSIGLLISDKDDERGRIIDVMPGRAAARAGIAPGAKLIAVNGRRYSKDVLHDALKATSSGAPLELLVETAEFIRSHRLDYRGGERYPWLERIPGKPDVLSQLIRAKR
jgi:predicted metalloprotease with PDZ domain